MQGLRFLFTRCGNTVSGFTLSEVLITLGVIGVVAALTIPGLIANYQKRITVNRLKQTYSILKQAERRAMEDDNGPDTWDFSTSTSPYSNSVINYFVPYLTNVTYCTYDTKKHDKVTSSDGTFGLWTIWVKDAICLPNGAMIYAMEYGSNGRISGVNVYVDINGDALPNIFGKDVFELYIQNSAMNDKYYVTFCPNELSFCARSKLGSRFDNNREELLKMCKSKGGNNGSNSCGVLIKDNGWEIPGDYPVKF